MADDQAMMWAEVDDIGSLLGELGDEEFDTPSLCSGWAVREVLGHMGLGHTTPMGAMVGRMAKHGFNVTKASKLESTTMFAGKSADDIRRPTGRNRAIPEDRLRRALDLARSEGSPMFSPKKNVPVSISSPPISTGPAATAWRRCRHGSPAERLSASGRPRRAVRQYW